MAATKSSASNSSGPWDGLIHNVPGFRTASLHCGLKTAKEEPPDLALVVCEELASAAGCFTKNRVCAAPVTVCRQHLKKSKGVARALIINAGNANACTGEQGLADALKMAKLTAAGINCKAEQVLVFSTGIIGHKLPMEKVSAGIARAVQFVREKPCIGDFARGIMTTDLVPKTAGAKCAVDKKTVSVAGACKGSGMIAPNMATMLGFVATDAKIAPAVLQKCLSEIVDETFNCVTVDGDTSTNDSIVVLASGKACNKPISKNSGADYEAFRAALHSVCDSLARQIAADGEGATHTVTVYVGGTKHDADAEKIARTIAESPLVKTAIAGNDPNWGRIVAAAGRAGVVFDPLDTSLTVNGIELFRNGEPAAFDKAAASAALKPRDTSLVLLVGDGPGRAKFYTCDLTHGYITINADYHT
ncbi:MAG TPA: bifunctional glutamate N-acetyltransferase/amino-acid acetyltransferase ArgJ [Planctomycetota bacterium]|nr:bifunctional glutamate N-acetyltransferase/amino-acid acetyltransferase ArgJ [Planctomycetota bacterium]